MQKFFLANYCAIDSSKAKKTCMWENVLCNDPTHIPYISFSPIRTKLLASASEDAESFVRGAGSNFGELFSLRF